MGAQPKPSGAEHVGGEAPVHETVRWISRSARATFRLGYWLGRQLEQGVTISLIGELGAGKTHLVQGLARGLGVPPEVPITSPTFSLINPYQGRTLELHHLDVYRLSSGEELELLGFRELLHASSVTVVEWANLFPEVMPPQRLEIRLLHRSERTRKIELTSYQGGGETLLQHLRNRIQDPTFPPEPEIRADSGA